LEDLRITFLLVVVAAMVMVMLDRKATVAIQIRWVRQRQKEGERHYCDAQHGAGLRLSVCVFFFVFSFV
jgi:hypothetical protein